MNHKTTTRAMAALVLLLLVPVFYCVVFIGNQMNYNDAHKIQTLYANPVLLCYAALVALIIFLGGVSVLDEQNPIR